MKMFISAGAAGEANLHIRAPQAKKSFDRRCAAGEILFRSAHRNPQTIQICIIRAPQAKEICISARRRRRKFHLIKFHPQAPQAMKIFDRCAAQAKSLYHFFSASDMFGRISTPQLPHTSTLLSRIHTQKRVEVLLQVYDLSTLLTQDQGSLLYTYPRCPFRYGECEWTQDPARQRYRPRAHACDDMRSG